MVDRIVVDRLPMGRFQQLIGRRELGLGLNRMHRMHRMLEPKEREPKERDPME